MKCPYIKPTIQNCLNCSLGDCQRADTSDTAIYVKRWVVNHPEKAKEVQRRKYKKYYSTHKEQENTRIAEWKKEHPKRVKKSVKRCGKRWRKSHRQEERERNRLNYLKRKERQAG